MKEWRVEMEQPDGTWLPVSRWHRTKQEAMGTKENLFGWPERRYRIVAGDPRGRAAPATRGTGMERMDVTSGGGHGTARPRQGAATGKREHKASGLRGRTGPDG